MKFPPKSTGLLQAAGVALYVTFFASLALRIRPWLRQNQPVHPLLGIVLFLLTFVLSALISGSLILGYPLLLFFEGCKAGAVKIIVWSAVYLFLFLCLFLLVALLFQR